MIGVREKKRRRNPRHERRSWLLRRNDKIKGEGREEGKGTKERQGRREEEEVKKRQGDRDKREEKKKGEKHERRRAACRVVMTRSKTYALIFRHRSLMRVSASDRSLSTASRLVRLTASLCLFMFSVTRGGRSWLGRFYRDFFSPSFSVSGCPLLLFFCFLSFFFSFVFLICSLQGLGFTSFPLPPPSHSVLFYVSLFSFFVVVLETTPGD